MVYVKIPIRLLFQFNVAILQNADKLDNANVTGTVHNGDNNAGNENLVIN